MKKLVFTLILLLLCVGVNAQQREIIGKVVDATSKDVIIGATVIVEGTTTGSITGMNGEFSFKAAKDANLEASFMGYKNKVVAVNGQKNIIIELEEDALSLEEIVVVGYGGQKRSSLSTSVASVKTENMMKSRSSLMGALQGQIAGVTISNNGGEGQSIVIRGQGSRNGDPILYIVDGIPGASYSQEDVESVTILKDAAAASIYGANAGSGGVILITTKKAKEGGLNIRAKVQLGVQQVTNLPEMLTAEQYNMVRTDAANLSGTAIPPACDPNYYPYGSVTRTDWLDEIFRTGKSQKYSVSFSGGSEQLLASATADFSRSSGTLLGKENKGLGVHMNVDFKPKSWITISERASYSFSNNVGSVTTGGHTGVMMAAMFYPRSATVYEMDQDGNYVLDSNGDKMYGGTVPLWASDLGVAGSYGEIQNPVATLERLNQYKPSHGITSTTSLAIKPISGLTIKSDFTAKASFNRSEVFVQEVPEIGKPNLQNSRTIDNSLSTSWIWESFATYEKIIGRHDISVMGGASMKYSEYHSNSTTVKDFSSEEDFAQDFVNGSDWTSSKPYESFSQEATVGMFARAAYSYDDRYFFVASIRRDATSKLYYENNSGVFPAFSAAWKLTAEEFMQNQQAFDMIKLRASWGSVGNVSSVSNYSYVSSLSQNGRYIYLGDSHQNPIKGLGLSTITNRDLTWESSEQTDIGVDFTLLNSRLTVTADYYNKKTRDLIETMSIPSVAGLMVAPKANVGLVENKGFEFSVAYADVAASGLRYNISANAAYLKNRVLDLGGDESMAHTNTIRAMQPLRSAVGQSWYSYHLIATDGLFQTQEEIDSYVYTDANGKTSKIQPNAQPGDIKFIDYNNDGIIGDDDRQYMGSYMPKYTFGAVANFEYKGFDLSLQFQGVADINIFNGVKVMTSELSQGWNMTTSVLDSWGYDKTSENPILTMSDKNNNTTTVSDYFLEDASYLRFKNLTLGYTLPRTIFGSKSNVDMRLYFSGDNLFTITGYSGIDPEVGNYGLDGGVYPVARLYTFGINLTF